MKNYFNIREFIIDKTLDCIPVHVVEKIMKYHLPILNSIRHELGIPVIISKRSGFRPMKWELDHGRSGSSQHTFLTGNGAVDVTCAPDRLPELLELLKDSDYRRVCYYPEGGFIHCDFKGNEKQYFVAVNGIWKFKGIR